MKAVTVAAGAALVGSAVAGSHVQKMHQKLHARSDWSDWSNATTAATPVLDSTTASYDWTTKSHPVVDTSKTTTTATASYSGCWGPDCSTSGTPVVATSKTTTSSSISNYWGDWSSSTTSSEPVVATSSSSSSMSWGDWESSTSSDPVIATSTMSWGDSESSSSSTPVVATSTDTMSWGDWQSTTSSVPVVATSSTPESWSEPESVTVTTLYSTTTTTIWLGTASTPASATASSPAGGWGSPSASSSTPVAATSSVPVWSSNGWSGAPWPTSESMCVQQILTSYGAPTWYPTPGTVTVTVTPVASSTASTWPAWGSSSSSTPVVASSASSSWADWESSTTSTPVVATSTSAGWGSSSASGSTSTGWGAGFYSASSTASAGWSSSSASSSSGSGSGSLASNGNYFGMTYSPYTSSGGCKDAGTVSSDIASIAAKGFTTVRVYSTDCDTLENVGNAAKSSNLKVILGVFISSTGISGAQEQVTDITNWAQWDLVDLIVVGNEAVFNGYCSASDLAGFISSSKGAFQAAGYTGSVTTTEPLDTWQSSGSDFCSVIDVVAANLYAFFNAQTTADMAGDLIQAQIGILNGICSGKDTYVMESGWPTAGDCNGVACPSPENQATALKGIQSTSGSKIVFFSFEDDAWKAPGQFNVEQHWGCINVF